MTMITPAMDRLIEAHYPTKWIFLSQQNGTVTSTIAVRFDKDISPFEPYLLYLTDDGISVKCQPVKLKDYVSHMRSGSNYVTSHNMFEEWERMNCPDEYSSEWKQFMRVYRQQ